MQTLCPFCLQVNPHSDHLAAHQTGVSPMTLENMRMIAKHMAAEMSYKKNDGSIQKP
jgi:hypothetical protein